MPDLESKITTWHKDMLGAGMSFDAVAELESHLRDDIARQIKSGTGESAAFENSVRGLGQSIELQREFKKVRSFRRMAAKARDTMLSLAGIPNQYAFMNEPAFNVPSRWGTYLRSALFLLPALVLWSLATVYVIPQFNYLWHKAVWDKNQRPKCRRFSFGNLLRFDLGIMYLFESNILWLAGLALIVLGLLEWRVARWPRYRRAVIGAGVFLVNLIILFSISVLFLAATFAAAQFASHAMK